MRKCVVLCSDVSLCLLYMLLRLLTNTKYNKDLSQNFGLSYMNLFLLLCSVQNYVLS